MSSVGTHTIGAGGSCVDCGRGSEDMGGNPCHTNPSPTHDSEDWLDKILREIYDRLATEDTGIDDDYFIEDTDYKKRILAHYAHYLKPEEVEAIIGFDGDMTMEINPASDEDLLISIGENANNRLRAEQRERLAQLSRFNREEE